MFSIGSTTKILNSDKICLGFISMDVMLVAFALANNMVVLIVLLIFFKSKRCISWNLGQASVKLPSPNSSLPPADAFLTWRVHDGWCYRKPPTAKAEVLNIWSCIQGNRSILCCDAHLGRCWICANQKVYFLFLLQLLPWEYLLSQHLPTNISSSVYKCLLATVGRATITPHAPTFTL